MIEKKEDHLKDEERDDQPHADHRMVKPCWPPPARKPVKVIFEVENLAGVRVDVNIHVSEFDPNPPPPPFYRMSDSGEVEAPEEVDPKDYR